MDRHLTLAAVFAAAVHGGLLFGIPSRPAPARPAAAKPIDAITFERLPPDPEEILAPPDDPQPKGNPDALRPIIEDVRVAVRSDDFTQPSIETPPVDVRRITQIVPGILGISDGSEKIARPVVFRPGSLDRSPRALVQTPPLYPYDKKKEGINGEVQVEFTVDEAGTVIEPRVIHSTDRSFDEPTLQAVRKWRFEPGRRDGRIVRFRMVVPVHFSLHE